MKINEETSRFGLSCLKALQLAPDTLQRYGVEAQRAKCLNEMRELHDVIIDARFATTEHDDDSDERAIIDECADVLIMAISCASTIGAINWVEQLADRIEFKVVRTRDRMSKP